MSLTAEPVQPGRLTSILLAIPLLVFLAVLLGTLAWDLSSPRELPAKEKAAPERDLAQDIARILDGDAARDLEQRLGDTSPTRLHARVLWARVLRTTLAHLKDGYHEGAPGWFFIEGRAGRRAFIDAEALQQAAVAMQALAHRLEERGTRLAILPVPRKALIAREKTGGLLIEGVGLDALWVRSLQDAGVLTPDIPTALAMRDPEQVWWAADSHWSTHGARIAAETAVDWLGLRVPTDDSHLAFRIVSRPVKRLRDMTVALGLDHSETPFPPLADPRSEMAVFSLAATGEPVFTPRQIRRTNAPQWLVGTSYSTYAGGAFPLFLELLTGRPIANRARPGQGAFKPMLAALREIRASGQWPSWLFWELPTIDVLSGHALRRGPHAYILDLIMPFLSAQSIDLWALPRINDEVPRSAAPVRVGRHGPWATLAIDPDRLSVLGDGSLHYRLRRGSIRRPISVRLAGEGIPVRLEWGAELDEIEVPLAAGRPIARPSLALLLSEPELDASKVTVRLAMSRRVPDRTSWLPMQEQTRKREAMLQVTASPQASFTARRGSMLFLHRTGGSTKAAGLLAVSARTSGGLVPIWRSRSAPARTASLVPVGLGALAGETVSEFLFEFHGTSTAGLAISVAH